MRSLYRRLRSIFYDWFHVALVALLVLVLLVLVAAVASMHKYVDECVRAGGSMQPTGTQTLIFMPAGNGVTIPVWIPDTVCVIPGAKKQ